MSREGARERERRKERKTERAALSFYRINGHVGMAAKTRGEPAFSKVPVSCKRAVLGIVSARERSGTVTSLVANSSRRGQWAWAAAKKHNRQAAL